MKLRRLCGRAQANTTCDAAKIPHAFSIQLVLAAGLHNSDRNPGNPISTLGNRVPLHGTRPWFH